MMRMCAKGLQAGGQLPSQQLCRKAHFIMSPPQEPPPPIPLGARPISLSPTSNTFLRVSVLCTSPPKILLHPSPPIFSTAASLPYTLAFNATLQLSAPSPFLRYGRYLSFFFTPRNRRREGQRHKDRGSNAFRSTDERLPYFIAYRSFCRVRNSLDSWQCQVTAHTALYNPPNRRRTLYCEAMWSTKDMRNWIVLLKEGNYGQQYAKGVLVASAWRAP
ncbi:uncharacterized protein BDR25DRAFT_363425 [Lindgomyces ingoldianus]|uniref:Uncharacterized protein n=1 Tax=Lindgomyces ingoldianus TaxID=673940 RepID=A0ACB6Q8H1_9PLEO|nr:uncharacterized protein BDR25DRAFT_363425 [Lindgomyces ingoldianus]KAF2462893.1 hypothetical protein BDR25DRAFT_363425 [Lindgomyces ingoldianus]